MGDFLQLKKIVLIEDQEIDQLVGYKFSVSKYLKNLREYDNDGNYTWHFSFRSGYYEIYNASRFFRGEVFYALELAVTTLNRFMVVSKSPDFNRSLKFRLKPNQQLKASVESFR